MGPSLHQCPSISGKVCNHFLPVKDNNLHRLCIACGDKTCDAEGRCDDCRNWSDKCRRVGKYLAKLSAQYEKKSERKAKASSSSFSGFSGLSLSMPVTLCNLPSPVCSL